MSPQSWTYLIAACVGVFSLALWAAFVLVPGWTAYTRWWERIAATFLSLYVLIAVIVAGGGVAALVLYNYDKSPF